MSEAVAIISVSASGVVGVGGLLSAYWAGARERIWRSREERTIELRGVLEKCADAFTEWLLSIGQAHHAIAATRKLAPDANAALGTFQKQMWMMTNRIGVHRGSESEVYKTADGCLGAGGALMVIIYEAAAEGPSDERERAYRERWQNALNAQKAYLDVSAQILAAQFERPRRLRQRRSSRRLPTPA